MILRCKLLIFPSHHKLLGSHLKRSNGAILVYHKTLFSSPDKKMIISATWEQVTLQEAVTITNRSRAISSSMNHRSLSLSQEREESPTVCSPS